MYFIGALMHSFEIFTFETLSLLTKGEGGVKLVKNASRS